MTMAAIEKPLIGDEEVEEISRYFAEIKAISQMAIEVIRERITEIQGVANKLLSLVETHRDSFSQNDYLRILIIIVRDLQIFITAPCEMYLRRINEAIDRSIIHMAAYLSMAN